MRFLQNIQTILTGLCGLFLVLSFLPGYAFIAYLSVLCGSYFALVSAWDSLRRKSIDVNFLMVLAAGGAVAVGQPKDAAALLFLFSLSSTLESLAMARTKSAIEGLVRLRPESAVRVLADGEETVPVEQLAPGDLIRVLSFEQIPTDGTVAEGESSVNQASMTGESVPVPKEPGDLVMAGTQNMEGMLLVRVTHAVGDSTLDKIVSLVREAQDNKASGERISLWFGQRYTLFVLLVFGASLVLRLSTGAPWSLALYTSLTLLVALSPCALVISTPATTLTALAWAARNGILVRGGEYIELSGKVDTLAIDKTGTLTEGKPQLMEICVFSPTGVNEELKETACWSPNSQMPDEVREALRLAASVEQHSTHPIAAAIVASATAHGVEVGIVTQVSVIPGFGVAANVGGIQVRVGQRRLFEQADERLEDVFIRRVEAVQAKGMTVVVAVWGTSRAAFGLRDAPRAEAPEFLAAVRQHGVSRIVLLTGDTTQTAKAVAEELGIEEYRASLLPADKTRIITELGEGGRAVMMIGDGVNDAPSLAKASVGVAMGGLGSDVALNAADVVLMQDRLVRIPDLIRLGKRTNSIIRTNLLFAAGVICALTIGSLFGVLPLPIAVLGHEGSTVLVILNGLRLLKGP